MEPLTPTATPQNKKNNNANNSKDPDFSLATFVSLFLLLKEPKDYLPTNVREEQKRTFGKAVEDIFHTIEKMIKEALAVTEDKVDPKFLSATFSECSKVLEFIY